MLLSSYPGFVNSLDDYCITNQKLAVMETSNDIQNRTLYDFIQPEGSVPYFLRVTLANRLSEYPSDWVEIFPKYNSGTYINQWMVVDYKKYTREPCKCWR